MFTPIATIVMEDNYLYRFAEEVYQKRYPRNERKYPTRHLFVMAVLESIGPRPTPEHHLFLTGNFESPVEWKVPRNSFLRDYLYDTY
jgi:hypothetical protein